MFKKILTFFILACIITVIFGAMYAAVQQNYRQSAYDPQIQMAEDTAAFLSAGGDIQKVPTLYTQINTSVDFASSLASFVIVYDSAGKVVTATGNMNGSTPTPPMGVLQSAQTYGENRLTWQPQYDVRIATVVVPYTSSTTTGFVLVGRNLREVENRVSVLTQGAAILWGASEIGSLLVIGLLLTFGLL